MTEPNTEAEHIALYSGISDDCYFINVIQRGARKMSSADLEGTAKRDLGFLLRTDFDFGKISFANSDTGNIFN